MKTKNSLIYKNQNQRKDQPLRFQQPVESDDISSINDLFKVKDNDIENEKENI